MEENENEKKKTRINLQWIQLLGMVVNPLVLVIWE